MKQVLQLPRVQESIFSNEIENIEYLVKLNRNGAEWGHQMLSRFGHGTSYEKHQYCWTDLLSTSCNVSFARKNNSFFSKKDACEWAIQKEPQCLIMAFDSENEFLNWVESKIKNRFGKRNG